MGEKKSPMWADFFSLSSTPRTTHARHAASAQRTAIMEVSDERLAQADKANANACRNHDAN